MTTERTPREVGSNEGRSKLMQHLARLLELEGMCIMRADRAEWWALNREREKVAEIVRAAILDGERYRFLRDDPAGVHWWDSSVLEYPGSLEFDAAVDAAIGAARAGASLGPDGSALSEGLGPVARTARGFELLEFKDRYGTPCSLQASSMAEYEKPGTSAVWLGPDDAAPKVLASQARSLGVTAERTGWVPYPIPPGVSLTTRMHLDREQVAALIVHLQSWLDNDSFAGPNV